MKEFGSEFWSVPLSDKENCLYEDVAWFLSGRTALRCIINDIKRYSRIDSVALPAWCCDSMIIPFLEEGVKVGYYPVYLSDHALNADYSDIDRYDAVLMMDYFGYRRQSFPVHYQGILIHDKTHLPFTKPFERADYAFGSLRKWSGFYTGGFAEKRGGELIYPHMFPPDTEYVRLRETAMREKEAYISGRSGAKDYLKLFQMAEKRLDSLTDICAASQRDIDAAKYLDIALIRNRRRENARILLKYLDHYALFKTIEEYDCPMFVPIVVPYGKRDELRNRLIKKDIYCPVHWPRSPYQQPDKLTTFLYDNTLSVICDQRYSASDMARIAQTIINFLGEPYAERTNPETM